LSEETHQGCASEKKVMSHTKACEMATARVFRSCNSQAVRLPNQFRFKGKEVEIFRRGDEVVLREKVRPMERAFELLANLSIDVDAVAKARKSSAVESGRRRHSRPRSRRKGVDAPNKSGHDKG
jgi:antitoxin VapB